MVFKKEMVFMVCGVFLLIAVIPTPTAVLDAIAGLPNMAVEFIGNCPI